MKERKGHAPLSLFQWVANFGSMAPQEKVDKPSPKRPCAVPKQLVLQALVGCSAPAYRPRASGPRAPVPLWSLQGVVTLAKYSPAAPRRAWVKS